MMGILSQVFTGNRAIRGTIVFGLDIQGCTADAGFPGIAQAREGWPLEWYKVVLFLPRGLLVSLFFFSINKTLRLSKHGQYRQ